MEKGPDDDLFGTTYWSALRVAVLRGYNHECMCCGGYASEVHHIRPRQFGGGDHPRNMMPLCKDCHDEIHRRIDRAFPDVFGKVTESFVGNRTKATTLDAFTKTDPVITMLIPTIK